MHILGTHMYIHTKYEVSILNSVARRAVHRCQCRRQMMLTPMLDNNYAQGTNHDYIDSFGRIPNEPKTIQLTFKGSKVTTFLLSPEGRCRHIPVDNWAQS